MQVRRRNRRRQALRIAGALAALVLLTSGVGHAMVTSAEHNVRRVDPFSGLRDRPEAGSGLNILLIGTDSRDGLSADERAKYHVGDASCRCADAVLLLHVSESRERATVVSLPRDSYAELPEHTFTPDGSHHEPHADKLNAALSHGGPSLMVNTVEDLTGLRVDHYLEVSFVSFMRAVDEIGGVEICAKRPLKDPYSGLDLPAGTSTLDGPTALAYVRARHLDGTSDLDRMERQQRFLAAFLKEAVSTGVLLNPAQVSTTADALLDSVRVDPGFGAEEMLRLAGLMRHFTTDGAQFASVPLKDASHHVPGLGSTVRWNEQEATRLFHSLRTDTPLPAPPPTTPPSEAQPPKKADEFAC
ncbi:LCP family protein [Streptomyces radicis]|uniref:LytR family transcriptional regulator n=1 Tax=Streptomyces radicis TaxID=1750517 RepID=A0A3A9W6C0_9ACTN|nr:LCP family protein [Streptomyces radicis]RKN08745.1 LytR family transcriptional regulator [Streptomyces radicis]RKN21903.1 LytR family transcriptional regulator [Streptomyces radicis]